MKYLLIASLLFFFIGCNSPESSKEVTKTPEVIIDGEFLFKSQCASCHKCMEDFTGPALNGANERWNNKELLYEFIRNPQSVIAKDKYAMELYDKYKTAMLPFPDLSDAEIKAILDYCGPCQIGTEKK